MEIGTLNQRITILEHRTVIDEIGNHTAVWDEAFSCWAKVTMKNKQTKKNIQNLQEYADLADTAMKKAVRKTATQVKNEISANAPKDTGKYAKSWATKKTGENSHSLEMTVHSKNRYQLAHLLEKGHAKRGGGRVSGKPHIAPAEENGVQLLEHLIEGALS